MQDLKSKRNGPRQRFPAAVLALLCLGLAGCSHFHTKPRETYVYVTAKQTYLRDRVAAVSNRTGEVTNGEKLEVLDHARRFVKVRTPRGEVGWLEDRPNVLADQATADAFAALGKEYAKDPVVGQATVRDEALLHISPGRKAPSFYRLEENDQLQLLKRATVLKPVTPGAAPAVVETKPGAAPAGPPPPVMEDWWLVRNARGETGWIYSRLIDVNAPDTLARYSEGQRIVGAYILGYADDPDSGMLDNGATVTRIPEYVSVLGPYKAGLPYDFDQVRVFTWNTKKHRYETAFREKNIAGYLPVTLGTATNPYGHTPDDAMRLPSFTYLVLAGDQPMPTPDPVSGLIKPGRLIEKTYRLVGNITQRVIQPGVPPPPEAHPVPEPEKKVKARAAVRVKSPERAKARAKAPAKAKAKPRPKRKK
jgi:uncharacterized protein YgiM (DUF1202 family)